ncbi:LysM peptidoglycan-binding domain-containing protein [Thiohalorhabdus sp. Cl-TMA]|uniref:LysM peptidoglycan-binding domain-containing protein n=1 Tax=Thiohalorhabdus methylotrophus TaxID=3242694 RepID=A0ABV4TTX2_9GAMM
MIRANRLLYLGGMVLGASLALGGCASQPTEEAPAEQAEMSMQEKAAQAVSEAEAAVKKTQQETDDWGLWKSTLGILNNAKNSLEQGDYQAAIDAAEQAKFQAEKGLEQYQEEQEEYKKAEEAAKQRGDFPEEEWVGAAKAGQQDASRDREGGDRMAGERKSVANGTLIIQSDDQGLYKVGRGDTLWDVASADAIYGNPFAWPLIYKFNSGKINDPDLIFPSQEFEIMWNVDSAAFNAAVRHAKTRGSWRLGEPEASDLEYLEQN